MYTPLDIENKKFSKQMMNGYSVEEVDDFLDELTVDYEKIYKQTTESNTKIESLMQELEKYKNIESTLQNTLIMAQSTADEIKKEAQGKAKEATMEIEKDIAIKTKELDDLQKQFDVYKAKMESLLISQLELLKDSNKE